LLELGAATGDAPSAAGSKLSPEEQQDGVELAEDEGSSLSGASALSGASRVALHASLQLQDCLVAACPLRFELWCAKRPVKETEVGLRLATEGV